MSTQRLEAFSDAVIAIIMTIMVLELRIPEGASLASLQPLLPKLLSYVVSFVYLAIYWNNHHHMIHVTQRSNGAILWANMHLLFWLSLVPATTAWLGANPSANLPVAVYGIVLLLAAVSYFVLQNTIIRVEGESSRLRKMIGKDLKGKVSPVAYLVAIVLAFFAPVLSEALYVLVALMWLVPDRRIESKFEQGA